MYDLWVAVVGNISENTGVKSAKKKLDQEPLFLNQETLFALLLGIENNKHCTAHIKPRLNNRKERFRFRS